LSRASAGNGQRLPRFVAVVRFGPRDIVTLAASVAVVGTGAYVFEGESHDPWKGLGVEQDEQADDGFGQVHAIAIV